MPFTKGREKTGGRKKGTPNKASVGIRLEEMGCDPIEFMARVMNGEAIEARLPGTPENAKPVKIRGTLDQRISVAKELAGFVAPKRKAIEGGPDGSEPVKHVFKWEG